MIGPFAVIAAAVPQQSQTLVSSTSLAATRSETSAVRRLIAPRWRSPPCCCRPSSQKARTAGPSGSNDTKPCSVWVSSSCAWPSGFHVFPPSVDRPSITTVACDSSPRRSAQWAINAPSAASRTEGTSAQLTTRAVPETTVSGGLHDPARQREKRSLNVFAASPGSIQLSSSPSPPGERLPAIAPSVAGGSIAAGSAASAKALPATVARQPSQRTQSEAASAIRARRLRRPRRGRRRARRSMEP